MATTSDGGGSTLEHLPFDNFALRELPLDAVKENYVRTTPGCVYSRACAPTPVDNPRLVCFSASALASIGIPVSETSRPDFAAYFSGNQLLPGAEPAAHCYCGHQFGSFAGQLGDGATMYLGQVATPCAVGVTPPSLELQFKGAGRTPYSRSADGRKVLRSSIREFLMSEHMAALGVPSTRAGTLVTSDSRVERDAQYTGDVQLERASVITRIAPTFIRFGSFEVARVRDAETGRAGPSVGNLDLLRALLNFTVEHYYPAIAAAHSEPAARWAAMYLEVVARSARLVAAWQGIGWCHGVLNTDNMSILGLTLDYGPFGFMDVFSHDFICNASDHSGRYAYKSQPGAVRWNCATLAASIAPVFDASVDLKTDGMRVFNDTYNQAMRDGFSRKLGLSARPRSEATMIADDELVQALLDTMDDTGADFTLTFRALMTVTADSDVDAVVPQLVAQCASVAMHAQASRPNSSPMQLQRLLALAQRDARYAHMLPDIQVELERWTAHAALSRRSEAEKRAADVAAWQTWTRRFLARLQSDVALMDAAQRAEYETTRKEMMAHANPLYILRNWIAQQVIDAAEKGDYAPLHRVAARMADPYALNDAPGTVPDEYAGLPPAWAAELKVT